MEKQQWIQSTDLEAKSTHVRILVELFVQVERHQIFHSLLLCLFLQLSSSLDHGRLRDIESLDL